ANDPVTWLDFGATFTRPDFLREDRGPGVPAQMVWLPVITTLQLAVDQLASGVPAGQGHEFGQAPVYAWAEILPPEAWPQSATESLAEWLAELRLSDLGSTSSSE
ncbi:MAG: alpha/beta-hydrolase family protein, partial [Actinobacteria bacterium]|nr:alpha/beta-hydrolase family protein [Actinomycetota bacterium]